MYHLSRLTRSLLQIRPVDLSARARAIAEELRQREPGRDVEVVIGPDITAEGDPALLGVLVDNLLGNAWKYTAHASRARIEFGTEAGEAGETVYCVRDNGAGFDMLFVDKLFRLFQRLHRNEDFGGQGVGLATAQRVVQRHGGRIWANAEKGRGATFRFTLWDDLAVRHEVEEDLRQRLAG
jgi:light-regulated signal transduction histidine kinase (bacteriophytochrome)